MRGSARSRSTPSGSAGNSASRSASPAPPQAIPDDVVALARGGKKIEAIKRYRELTGVDLREAKDAVDRL